MYSKDGNGKTYELHNTRTQKMAMEQPYNNLTNIDEGGN